MKANREKHRQLFEAAQAGYREAVIVELDRMLVDASRGNRIKTTVELNAPIDQTKEYDRVVMQLEMETRNEIELTDEEFANYVMDQWRWTPAVLGITENYVDWHGTTPTSKSFR